MQIITMSDEFVHYLVDRLYDYGYIDFETIMEIMDDWNEQERKDI